MNPGSTRLLVDALAFAAYKHRRQRRKDPEASPYINHPIALAHVLSSEAGISTWVAELEQFADDKTLSKADRKRLQIEHAEHLSRRARLVKLADKISNVRDIAANPPHDWPLQRRREYFDWAKAVVDRIRGTNKRLARAFDEAYAGRP